MSRIHLSKTDIEYFGTSLHEHGHYRWVLQDGQMIKVYNTFDRLPFNPEEITNSDVLQKGDVVFYQGGGLTVVGICGSCKDTRPGTKSIFWVNDIITRQQLIDRIKAHPIAAKLIAAMPFEIKWNV